MDLVACGGLYLLESDLLVASLTSHHSINNKDFVPKENLCKINKSCPKRS